MFKKYISKIVESLGYIKREEAEDSIARLEAENISSLKQLKEELEESKRENLIKEKELEELIESLSDTYAERIEDLEEKSQELTFKHRELSEHVQVNIAGEVSAIYDKAVKTEDRLSRTNGELDEIRLGVVDHRDKIREHQLQIEYLSQRVSELGEFSVENEDAIKAVKDEVDSLKKEIEKASSSIIEQKKRTETQGKKSLLLENKITALERDNEKNKADIKRVDTLHETISRTNKSVNQITEMNREIKRLSKLTPKMQEEEKLLKERITSLEESKEQVVHIEDIEDLKREFGSVKEKVERTAGRIESAVETSRKLNSDLEDEFGRLEDKFNKVRINGLPLTPRTEITADNIRAHATSQDTLATAVQKRFNKTVEQTKEDIESIYKEGEVPITELKEDLSNMGKRIDKLTKVNSVKTGLLEQRSFNELFEEVTRKNKGLAKQKKRRKKDII